MSIRWIGNDDTPAMRRGDLALPATLPAPPARPVSLMAVWVTLSVSEQYMRYRHVVSMAKQEREDAAREIARLQGQLDLAHRENRRLLVSDGGFLARWWDGPWQSVLITLLAVVGALAVYGGLCWWRVR